ncbi:MAG: YIP1 family protein [Gemmatimonadaceae bacterium]|nr:YIP1 family protein [Gemmatimonadaceae bacterium]
MAPAVTTTDAPSRRLPALSWIPEEGQLFWMVATAPGRGFAALAARPAWLLLFLVVFGLNAAYTRPMLPLATQAALSEVSTKAGPQSADGEARIGRQVRTGQIIGIVMSPVLLLFKWLAVAMLLWAAVTLVGGYVSLRAMFSLAAHANVPLILGYFMNLQLLLVRGPDAIGGLDDLRPRLGLNAFLPGASPGIDVWLGSIGPLDVWFVLLLVIGLEQMAQVSRRTAVGLALGYWLLSTGLQASLAGFGR